MSVYDKLSGNPSSERPRQIADQLEELSERFHSEDFKQVWEKLLPNRCACCEQALFEDAAAMLRSFAQTPEGADLEGEAE